MGVEQGHCNANPYDLTCEAKITTALPQTMNECTSVYRCLCTGASCCFMSETTNEKIYPYLL